MNSWPSPPRPPRLAGFGPPRSALPLGSPLFDATAAHFHAPPVFLLLRCDSFVKTADAVDNGTESARRTVGKRLTWHLPSHLPPQASAYAPPVAYYSRMCLRTSPQRAGYLQMAGTAAVRRRRRASTDVSSARWGAWFSSFRLDTGQPATGALLQVPVQTCGSSAGCSASAPGVGCTQNRCCKP